MALSDRQHHPSRQVAVSRVSVVDKRNNDLDNDDDGESAAGGRLAHLLQILVCIYRCYYSQAGIHIQSTFSGGQQCASHRDALLWRDPFRTG